MNYPSRPTRADIDLNALIHNLHQVRAHCTAGQGVLAVVKADAYGHGAAAVSRVLEREGVEQFGVATLEEGIELRSSGIRAPILVLGGCYPGQEETFVRQGLSAAVLSLNDLHRLELFGASRGLRFPVHVKCDTGMGRVGILPHEIAQLCEQLAASRGLELLGLMSHLACADEPESEVTRKQIETFRGILAQLKRAGIFPPAVHLGNSAGLVAWNIPEATLVRPGIMLYGGYPAPDFRSRLDLQPVMSFTTRVAQLRRIEAGQGVSYGQTFKTERPTLLATLPVGYADGYNRLFSGCGEVLIRGERAPVVGRVCMDWIMVDVTGVKDVAVGDRVVLLGKDAVQAISAEDWAAKINSINYEVFCRISKRVPRFYLGPDSD